MAAHDPKKSNVVVCFSLPPAWHTVLLELHAGQEARHPGERSWQQFARDLLVEALAQHALDQELPHPSTTEIPESRAPRLRTKGPAPVLPPRPKKAPPPPPPPKPKRAPRRSSAGPEGPLPPPPSPLELPPELRGLSASALLERVTAGPGSTPEGVQATLDAILGPGAVQAPRTPPEASGDGQDLGS